MVLAPPERSTLMRALAFVTALLMGAAAQADPFAMIICGSGGNEEFTQRFRGWGNRLYQVLTNELEMPAANVSLLMDDDTSTEKLSRETIQVALESLGAAMTDEDDLFLFIIGHGSHLAGESKINIPGPDFTARDIRDWTDVMRMRRLTVINAASASAGFINELSGPDRIICSATKSVEEKNATEFMEHFITGLEDGSADLDRDTRVSVYEACEQAAMLTRVWYESEGLISTEHALLDDNGDRLGSRLAEPPEEGDDPDRIDGSLAKRTWLRDFSFPEHVPQDLIDTYLENLNAVEELKIRKDMMEEVTYYAELEKYLIEAARANARIRKIAAEEPPAPEKIEAAN
jgi:hypothetical protein